MELTILQSIIFGIVQGVTEFLPISSSGHLVLTQYFLEVPELQVSFFVALHVGSLGAVVLYFWRDWFNIFHIKKDMEIYQKNPRLLLYIIIATIPAVIAGLLFGDKAESVIFGPIVTTVLITVGSFILFLADKFFTRDKSLEDVNIKNSIIIGLAQMIALVPGVSRSGMTISGARVCKFNREDAARFSFLISTPIIAGAGLMLLLDWSGDFNTSMLIGIIASFVASFATIHYFLAWIKKVSYAVFLYYSLGLLVFVTLTSIFIK
jgi:undecaprenyl-diphosphatase